MKVITIAPCKKPVVEEIDPGLESLQSKVGGYIEAIYPFPDSVALVCNDDGKLMCLPYNRCLKDDDGMVYDIVAGTFLIVGIDGCDFCSLTEELTEKYLEKFMWPELFIPTENGLAIIPILG